MLIRTEIGVDAASIDGLLRRNFPTSSEARLVQQLREDGLLTLGVVATDDEGQVLGYAAFSPVTLQEEDRQFVALFPLVVDKSVPDRELMKTLVYEGLDTLNEFGYAAVFVSGNADFYAGLGFKAANNYRLEGSFSDGDEKLQVYKLADNAFDDVTGKIAFAAPFSHL